MKRIFNYGLIIVILFSLYCSKEKEKMQNNNEYNSEITISNEESSLGAIELEFIGKIGSDEIDEYMFALPTDMTTDLEGNLYVLDIGFKNMRIYTSNGIYQRGFEYSKGRGPGEFMRPATINISEDNNDILIYDRITKRLSFMDKNNFKFKRSFLIPVHFCDVYSMPDKKVMGIYYRSFYQRKDDPLVHIFDQNGNIIMKFCAPQENIEELQNKNLQGATYAYNFYTDSHLFLSFGYPYEIRIYDNNGKLKRRFSKHTSFLGDEIDEGEFIFPSGRASGIVATNDSLILNFVYEYRTKETHLHAFDFEGRSRGEIHMSEIYSGKLYPVLASTTVYKDMIYLRAQDPYPCILMLKIKSNTFRGGE